MKISHEHAKEGMQTPNDTRTDGKHQKRTPKQIAALICAVLLAAMYLITFVVACLDRQDAGRLFAMCLLMTIALPILLWIILLLTHSNPHS